MEKVLLTVEEAAHVMSMGRTRIYELIKSGDLKSIKCGKSRRIVSESVRNFVKNASIGPV